VKFVFIHPDINPRKKTMSNISATNNLKSTVVTLFFQEKQKQQICLQLFLGFNHVQIFSHVRKKPPTSLGFFKKLFM